MRIHTANKYLRSRFIWRDGHIETLKNRERDNVDVENDGQSMETETETVMETLPTIEHDVSASVNCYIHRPFTWLAISCFLVI